MKKQYSGQGIIEIIVAVGIILIIAVTAISTIVQTFTIARLGDNETDASLWAQEGIEAVRSIKNQAWANITNGNHGIASGSGTWVFSGTDNIKSIYTRQIAVSDIYRDTSGNMQTSGCANMLDKNAKRVIVSNLWNSSPTRANNVTLETYYTNWKKTAFGNWASPSQESSTNLTAGADGVKIQTQGNYAYMARGAGGPNFAVFDISSATPTLVGSLTLTGNATNVVVFDRYAYVSNTDNGEELQIIDVCTPSAPAVVGTFNASGNSDANGVYVSGNYAYLARTNGSGNSFIIVDISTPSAPSLAGSMNLSGDGNEVVVLGNYAYVASSDNSTELEVVNVSTPSAPSLAGSLNLSGNTDTTAISGFNNEIIIGRANGDLDMISVSTPATPSLQGTYTAPNHINDVSLGNANQYAFIGCTTATNDLQIIDISVPATPTLLGTFNYGNAINGVSYASFNDRVYAATVNDSQELASFKPL